MAAVDLRVWFYHTIPGGELHVSVTNEDEAEAEAASACTPRTCSTRGPSWKHLLVVLGAILSFLEPFCGHLLPKVDEFS